MTFALALASLLTFVACGEKESNEEDSGRAASVSCEDEACEEGRIGDSLPPVTPRNPLTASALITRTGDGA